MEDRLIEIEKKYAFQEHLLEQLNEVVVDQQKRISELERRLKFLQDQLTSSDLIKKPEEETPPPHY